MRKFPKWEAARVCTSGPSKGARAFMRWFVEEYEDRDGYNLGIYNCRTVRGGATTSLHGEGRAVDLGFPVGDRDGDQLLKRLLRAVGRLGIQCIIYERKIYSAKSPEGRYYGGVAPHYDHLHVEFTREAAEKLNYKTIKKVMRAVSRKPGTRILKRGKRGEDVVWLQKKLGLTADGIYGPVTGKAVRDWKRSQKKRYPKIGRGQKMGRLAWRAMGVKPKF